MRIVFMGTPEYAVPSLRALMASRHKLVGVVTQPDRPKGRKSAPEPPPVKVRALEGGVPPDAILQPENPNDGPTAAALRVMEPDVFCVIAYGCILGREVLSVPKICALNAHGSLLPRYRGAAPIPAAILAGDTETGVTLIRMVRRMDAGPVLLARSLPIAPTDTAGTLSEKIAELSAALFVEGLDLVESGRARFAEQDESLATYAPKLSKESGRLDFSRSAGELERAVRAFHPWPVAWADLQLTYSRGVERIRIHAAQIVDADSIVPAGRTEGCDVIPGSILKCDSSSGIIVGCGDGSALRLLKVQLPGRHVMGDTVAARGLR